MEETTVPIGEVPKRLFHLVPERLFKQFCDAGGSYDCRNREEWGKNSQFIHTSSAKKTLKEKVADPNWSSFPKGEKFVLLEISTGKIKGAKFSFGICNGTKYFHIWGALPKNSYKTAQVERDENGKFLI